MTHLDELDPAAIDAYRQRRAPPGFAARVAARARRRAPRTPPLVWQSAAAVGLAAGSALVFVLVSRTPPPSAPEMVVPPALDFWVDISVPVDPPVSGLTDFGSVPQLPPRPEFDDASERPNNRSSAPRAGGTRLTLSTQQETIHEAV